MRRATVVVLAVVMILGLAGCAERTSGTGSYANTALSPDKLEQATERAFASATAFHMVGDVQVAGGEYRYDMHYGLNSSDGVMSIGGLDVRLRFVAFEAYMRAGRAFWSFIAAQQGASPRALQRVDFLVDKWVHIPPGDNLLTIRKFADRAALVQSLLPDTPGHSYSAGPTKTLRGVPATSFRTESDTVVYVPDKGTPYPLRVEGRGVGGVAEFDFSAWNVPFEVSTPPRSEIVELPPS